MPEIRQRILENMQKFSRAMIGAVLFLPVIGLIMALSSVLTNPTLIAETSFLHQLGQCSATPFGLYLATSAYYFASASAMAWQRIKKPKSHWFQ
ncbi:PTS system protein [Klebsiella pneumoniae]|uniref:PTS system protein n=1 Tax=Klebsiella pneumoniae TaxID=573 RepID=A0A4P0YIB9_KLEPN|nr:PTS system protein [Klebsiella pneumoniae]